MKKMMIVVVICLFLLISSASAHWTGPVERGTLISFLLDETGSMEKKKAETILSFNRYLDSLRVRDERVYITLMQFNSERKKLVCNWLSLDMFSDMKYEDYNPREYTPLYDSIAELIKKTEEWSDRVDEKVLVVIFTDGLENDSKEYDRTDIFKMIKEKEEIGWTFAYLGSNQDAWSEGQAIGTYQGNIYDWDNISVQDTFNILTGATGSYLDNGSVSTETFFEGQ